MRGRCITRTNLSLVSVGSHEKTSLVQHPPQRRARVQVGHIDISGFSSLGSATVCSRGLQASKRATSLAPVGWSRESDKGDVWVYGDNLGIFFLDFSICL